MWNRLSLNINKNIIMSIKMEWTYYGVRGILYGVPLVDKEPQSINDFLEEKDQPFPVMSPVIDCSVQSGQPWNLIYTYNRKKKNSIGYIHINMFILCVLNTSTVQCCFIPTLVTCEIIFVQSSTNVLPSKYISKYPLF